ncbi:MAG: lysophospholipid acyltransferase family protein [Cytophagaceae bacterium]|jgi:KDO2-lipid IV(A) lauroyltransferase|nr:lysophospholipid acyltransferase family protein [Cytophagaceae bacterium]
MSTEAPKDTRPFSKRLKYQILYYLVRFVIFITGKIPRRITLALYGGLGSLAYYFAGKSRDRAVAHLQMVFGKTQTEAESRKIAKRMYTNIGKNFSDIIRTFSMETSEELTSLFEVKGKEHLDAAFAKGKGVLALTGHYGAFEFLGPYIGLNYPFIAMGTKLKDPKLDSLIVKHRSRNNVEYIYRGENTMKLLRALKQGMVVPILIDQDTKVKSRFVEFMGIPAATPIGAVTLALKTGAAVVPMYTFLDENNKQSFNILPEIPMTITGDDEVDFVVNTKKMNESLEQFIYKDPSQWVWMHERWKTKPGEEIL